MANHEELKVSYWNANSIQNKIHEFDTFLNELSIDVACIQETMLNSDNITTTHPNYKFYRYDRIVQNNIRSSGGVAIKIKRSIKHDLLPSLDLKLLEAIGVEIFLNNGSKIEVWSGGANNTSIRQYYKRDLILLTNRNCSFFMNGDLNSKHRFWNCSRANTAGTILFNEQLHRQFLILHPSTHTHQPFSHNCQPSTIDLTITNGLHDTSEFNTHPANSDHDIITYSILINQQACVNHQRLIPLFRNANWLRYSQIVHSQLVNESVTNINQVTDTSQIDNMISKLTTVILRAQDKSVPFVKPTPYAVTLTPEIKDKIAFRNVLKRRKQRNPNIASILSPVINQLNKEIHENINEIVNSNFNHKLSTINHFDNNRSLWQTLKFLKNRNKIIPPLRVNNKILLTSEEKSNALAEQISENHSNPLAADNVSHTRFVTNTVNRYMFLSNHENTNFESTNENEIRDICSRLKSSKAPGLDKVHNSLIKHLPPIGYIYITFIMNCCLRLSYFPSSWKHAKVTAIRNKENRRPIH